MAARRVPRSATRRANASNRRSSKFALSPQNVPVAMLFSPFTERSMFAYLLKCARLEPADMANNSSSGHARSNDVGAHDWDSRSVTNAGPLAVGRADAASGINPAMGTAARWLARFQRSRL